MSEELSDLEKSLQLPDDWTEEREANSRKLLVERMAFLARFDHPIENSRLITVLVNECKIHGAHPTMEYFYDLPDQKVWPGYEPIKEALENLGYENIPELNLNNDIKFLNGDPDAYHPTPEEVRGEELRMMEEVYGISEEEKAELNHLETIYDKNLYMKCDSRFIKEDEADNSSEVEDSELEDQSNTEKENGPEDDIDSSNEEMETTENNSENIDSVDSGNKNDPIQRKTKEEMDEMSVDELIAEQDRIHEEEEKQRQKEAEEREKLDNSDENEVEAGENKSENNSSESEMPRERTKEEIGNGISIDDIEGDENPDKNPEPEKTHSQKGFKPASRPGGRGMPMLDGGMGGMHGHHGGGLGETLTAYGAIAANTILKGAAAVGSGFVNTTSNVLLPSRRKMRRDQLANSKVDQIKNSRESVEDLFSKYKSNLNIDGEPATDVQKELVKQKLENKLGHHVNRLAEGGEMAGRKNMSPESKEALSQEIAKTEAVVNEISDSIESDNSENMENMKKMLKNIQNLLAKLFGGKTKEVEVDEPSMGM